MNREEEEEEEEEGTQLAARGNRKQKTKVRECREVLLQYLKSSDKCSDVKLQYPNCRAVEI